MQLHELTAVIVFYQGRKDLLECIIALIKEGLEDIVVVNNNTKIKLNVVYPQVRIAQSSSNIGYGAGVNLGVTFVDRKYVLIMNPDVIVTRGSVRVLIAALKRLRVVAVGPRLTNMQGFDINQVGTKTLTPLLAIKEMSFLAKIFKRDDLGQKWGEVELIAGACLIVRRDVFLEVGGFDEKFFLYFEENDLCKRIVDHGYKIYHEPKVIVKHDWEPGKKSLGTSKEIFEQSRFYYFKKHFGLIWALMVEFWVRF